MRRGGTDLNGERELLDSGGGLHRQLLRRLGLARTAVGPGVSLSRTRDRGAGSVIDRASASRQASTRTCAYAHGFREYNPGDHEHRVLAAGARLTYAGAMRRTGGGTHLSFHSMHTGLLLLRLRPVPARARCGVRLTAVGGHGCSGAAASRPPPPARGGGQREEGRR
jgi:hypothetical protein